MSAAAASLVAVARHYDSRARRFGATALALDWPSLASVERRLQLLLEGFEPGGGASLNDLGCGWGAAVEVLEQLYPAVAVDYRGIDVAPEMVRRARHQWQSRTNAQFQLGTRCARVADWSIASGIFNVRLGASIPAWEAHVRAALEDLHAHSRNGFAVNFMCAAAHRPKPQVYTTDPQPWAELCSREFGRSVRVVHEPRLGEFTLTAR